MNLSRYQLTRPVQGRVNALPVINYMYKAITSTS